MHGVHKEKDIKKTAIMLIKVEVNVISVSNFAVFLQGDVILLILNYPIIGLAGYAINKTTARRQRARINPKACLR